MDRLFDHMRKLVKVRPVGEIAGEDPAALATQIEAALARGDIGAAPTDLRQTARGGAHEFRGLGQVGQRARGRPNRGAWSSRERDGQTGAGEDLGPPRGKDARARGKWINVTRIGVSRSHAGSSWCACCCFCSCWPLAAYGLTWLAENPGDVALTWRGVEYDVSLLFALGVVLALAVALGVVWSILRFVFRAPLVDIARRARPPSRKGFTALSRGMIAIGSGDARAATPRRGSAQAPRPTSR